MKVSRQLLLDLGVCDLRDFCRDFPFGFDLKGEPNENIIERLVDGDHDVVGFAGLVLSDEALERFEQAVYDIRAPYVKADRAYEDARSSTHPEDENSVSPRERRIFKAVAAEIDEKYRERCERASDAFQHYMDRMHPDSVSPRYVTVRERLRYDSEDRTTLRWVYQCLDSEGRKACNKETSAARQEWAQERADAWCDFAGILPPDWSECEYAVARCAWTFIENANNRKRVLHLR